MNYKIFLPLIFSIFLLSTLSAMTVYSDFSDGTQGATIDVGESISFNADFFSMNPPITSMKVQLYQGSNLISTFLNSNTNEKTYYHTYTYLATTAGTYKIKVIGTDSVNTDSEFLTLTVNPCPPHVNHAPVITSVPISQINEGAFYNYHVTATDSDGDTLTYSLNENPSWLSINSNTGVISGVAPSASYDTDYDITVKVSDGTDFDTQTYVLTVKIPCHPVNHAPVITSVPISQINEGSSYNYHVTATDSDGDTLTYSLTTKPSWLSINSNTGVISGVAPLVSSNTNFDVTVKVSDGTDFDTQTYVLTVKNIPCPHINHAPVITSSPITSITEGNIYTYDVQATDSDGDDLTYSIIDAPGWLHINSNSGIISGTAPQVDSSTDYQVELEVSDGNGGIDTQSYTLKVKNHVSGGTSSGIRVISDSDIYYQNRYFDQFETGQTVYTEKPTREVLGLSVSTFFYFLTAVISLGIIIVIYLLFKNIRR